MTTTSILTDQIMEQANAYRVAQAKFDTEFRQFAGGVPPLAPEHFWPMVEQFRKTLLRTMTYRKETAVEVTASEFLRELSMQKNLAAGIHFALSWDGYVTKAHRAGNKAPFSWERGDDGYGDLMDSLPILGQDVFDSLEARRFNTLDEFNDRIELLCPANCLNSVLKDMVLNGENYFGMSLREAAQKWVVFESRYNQQSSEPAQGFSDTPLVKKTIELVKAKPSSRPYVTGVQVSGDGVLYRVCKLTNAVEPAIGSILGTKEAKYYIGLPGWTVIIREEV